MRILAIRGCNLASLAGEFEVDLVHGPLGMAGVFAIVGPTGAGKSTLLDAMCVALFDRTPRLPGHSRVTVGHGVEDPSALGAQDPRTLLRRGAAHGWAEVDFESGDTRRYRARWSVRRARGATDGNLQDQQISLTAIDAESVITERLGGTKTETLKAIHARLGLTFDQFRRSALLAQGDFAAFLRAEGKDRSELLERMTGTEIYSKLSIAAHSRMVVAEQMLRERQAAALAIPIMEDVVRAGAASLQALAKDAREGARMRLAAAQQLAQWRGEASVRAAAVTAAEGEHAIGVADARGAEPLRTELVLRRRAEALRGVWDEAARSDREHAIAQGELENSRVAAANAAAVEAAIEVQHTRVAELHETLRAARIAAAIVDVEAPAPKRMARGTTDPLAPVGIAAIAEPAVARGEGALAAALWLSDRRALAPEIAAWPELETKLAQERALAESIAAAAHVLAEQAIHRGAHVTKQKHLEIARDAAQAKLVEGMREADAFVKRRTLGLDAAGRAEDQARVRCGEVDRLVSISDGARDAAIVSVELEMRLRELERVAAGDLERRTATLRERDAAAVMRDERARITGELRKAAGYKHARAELVEGEPCPLCGADEHPWKHRGTFDTLIADAERGHAEALAAWEAATRVGTQLELRILQHDLERARNASASATAVASAEMHAHDWRAQLAGLGELILVTDPAIAEATQLAAERATGARAKLEAARAVRSAAQAAEKAITEAQARVQIYRADLDHHLGDLRGVAIMLATLDAAIERVTGEQAGRLERHGELARELAESSARWHAALPGVTESVSPGSTKRRRRATVMIERGFFAELVQQWRECAALVTNAEASLAGALAELDRTRTAADRAVADTSARQAECAKRGKQLAATLAAANASLEAARIAASFEREALHRMLSGEVGRVDVLATELERLDRSVDRAKTRILERRRLVADHTAMRPASTAELELDADRVAELASAVTAADHHAAALAATLAADDDARARRAQALAIFAVAERAAEIDRVLGGVIGSHDGKLFRSFAQSLTLDQLLVVANGHLEELAPRYQLERVPKHDLELQVIDRDFGGEVRSVQSLSGGESFLVSLALALGLSSMSAHDVRVRTLLIDEGFGTLDPATLDSALAVLDELQATGRQVGIISHVPALLDRVRAHVRVTPRGGGRSDVHVPSI